MCTRRRFAAARQHLRTLPGDVTGRVIGLKANASNLPPDQLDKLDHLEEGQPERFAELMLDLRRDYGLRLLGGCCGTDDRQHPRHRKPGGDGIEQTRPGIARVEPT